MPSTPRKFLHIREQLLQETKTTVYALEQLLVEDAEAAAYLREAREALNDAIIVNREKLGHVQHEGILAP